jgi:hypothetical protein
MLEIAGIRLDHAHVAGNRLDNHRRDGTTVRRERLVNRVCAVERDRECRLGALREEDDNGRAPPGDLGQAPAEARGPYCRREKTPPEGPGIRG